MRAGFQELCGKDSRFEPYAATLFGQAAAELDRDAKSPESNRKLDASVAAFLALLAEYFLLPAAMQALEFLVRRLRCRQLQPHPDCACICMGLSASNAPMTPAQYCVAAGGCRTH